MNVLYFSRFSDKSKLVPIKVLWHCIKAQITCQSIKSKIFEPIWHTTWHWSWKMSILFECCCNHCAVYLKIQSWWKQTSYKTKDHSLGITLVDNQFNILCMMTQKGQVSLMFIYVWKKERKSKWYFFPR